MIEVDLSLSDEENKKVKAYAELKGMTIEQARGDMGKLAMEGLENRIRGKLKRASILKIRQ